MTEAVEYFTVPDSLEEDLNNILYVDDEESNLRVFDSVFSRYYNVYTANNGHTGIRMLREYDVHMIITDQKMPEMTGTDLLERVLEEFPDIIRIILTGFSDIQAIIKAINKCSIYKYITKPYENSEMREIIDKGIEIYNMRMEKYNAAKEPELEEGLDGHETGHTGEALPSSMDAQAGVMAQHMVSDLMPTAEDFEGYFDFHIDYHMSQEDFSEIYSDFVVHADEQGSRLFFITMKTTADMQGAMSYMHIKAKMRTLLEVHGNSVDLFDLHHELMNVYHDIEVSFEPHDLKIVAYDWEKGEFQYLTSESNIKLFSLGQQLEPLALKEIESDEYGYTLYSITTKQSMVVYFWDYELSEEGNEHESPAYFKQIVNHATSMPFDLQASQIASGIKSVSKHFTDAALFGLYLND
ncbi:MAG: response regulator [Cyclobacteriaceae bacterium]